MPNKRTPMPSHVKTAIVAAFADNQKLDDTVKLYIAETIEKTDMNKHSFSLVGRTLIIRLEGVDAIHIDNINKLILFQGHSRAEYISNKELYNKLFNIYYATYVENTPRVNAFSGKAQDA